MFKQLLSGVFILFFMSSLAFAQSGTIEGRVTDTISGEDLPGVNVAIKSLQKGVSTDTNGEYTLTNIPSGTYKITFSFIGYTTFETEINVSEELETLDVSLQPDLLGLDEIVVNALGFEENRDEIGVSSSTVSSQTLETTGETSILTSLSAKAPGVNITQSSGDPGSSARILIRGQNSLTQNNQPLFVVDGVPVSNETFGQGTGGTSQQSRISDINVDDIESVEVLKGPSAASLWGSRAANGVIVIKTKSGSTSGKVDVTVKSSLSIDDISKTVDLQTDFGQGFAGSYGWNSALSWGDRISSRSGEADVIQNGVITQKNSKTVYDHTKSGYETGYVYDNSVSISGGNSATESTYYLNLSNVTNTSILQGNSDYERTSVRINASKNMTSKLRTNVNANYVRTISDRVQTGSNISGINLGLWRTPADFNLNPYLVDYTDPSTGEVIFNRHRSYRNGNGAGSNPRYNNPLWTMNVAENGMYLDRFIGSTELVYSATDWLDVTHRIGIDKYAERLYELAPVFDATTPGGSLNEISRGEYQFNSDLILRSVRQLNDNIVVTGTVGYNINHREYDRISSYAEDFILPNQPRNISSADTRSPSQYRQTIRTSALYSAFDFGLYDQLFITVTGRSESASTYGEGANKTVFYPSANVAWQLTQLDMFADSDLLSFAKIRAEFGQAGVQPGPYVTSTPYEDRSHSSSWGPSLDPIAYGGGYAIDDFRGNPDIKNELVTEIGFGADLRFFNDKIGFGVTRYFTKTEDAILSVSLAPSSGFTGQVSNAGELENDGYELEMDISVVSTKNFQWITTANWFKNNSKVTNLAGSEEVGLAGFTGSASSLVEGQPYGVIYGDAWERDDEGKFVLDADGFPQLAPSEKVLGDPNPDWRASIGNNFKFKNLSLNVLVDIKHGGDVWNGTKGALSYFGKFGSQDWWTTLEGDQLNLTNYLGATPVQMTGNGYNTYVDNGDGTVSFRGYIEDFGGGEVLVDETAFWSGPFSGFTGPAEQFIEDGGYVRLREVTLSYSLNSKSFKDITGLKSVDFSVTGRNLALWTDYTGIDPETNLTGPSNGQGLDYFQVPNTRSWMFTLKVNY
jgi:TonB-linked SusC/RagA family outer membrane protein